MSCCSLVNVKSIAMLCSLLTARLIRNPARPVRAPDRGRITAAGERRPGEAHASTAGAGCIGAARPRGHPAPAEPPSLRVGAGMGTAAADANASESDRSETRPPTPNAARRAAPGARKERGHVSVASRWLSASVDADPLEQARVLRRARAAVLGGEDRPVIVREI